MLIEHDIKSGPDTYLLQITTVFIFPENAVVEPENVPQPIVVTDLRPYIHAAVAIEVAPRLETVAHVGADEKPLAGRVITGKDANRHRPEVFVPLFWEVVRIARCEAEPPIGRRHELPLDIGPKCKAALVGLIGNWQAYIDAGLYPGVFWIDFSSALLGIDTRCKCHHHNGEKKRSICMLFLFHTRYYAKGIPNLQ